MITIIEIKKAPLLRYKYKVIYTIDELFDCKNMVFYCESDEEISDEKLESMVNEYYYESLY